MLHRLFAKGGRRKRRVAHASIWITKTGPRDARSQASADPEPRAGEVRIRVEASGVNFADIMGRMGLYPDCPPFRRWSDTRSAAASTPLEPAPIRTGLAATFSP